MAKPGIGHNSVTDKKLHGIITEIEDGEEKKSEWGEHIKAIYTAAKAQGYDVKVIRRIVKDRKADREKLAEQNQLYDTYLLAVDPELAEVLS